MEIEQLYNGYEMQELKENPGAKIGENYLNKECFTYVMNLKCNKKLLYKYARRGFVNAKEIDRIYIEAMCFPYLLITDEELKNVPELIQRDLDFMRRK